MKFRSIDWAYLHFTAHPRGEFALETSKILEDLISILLRHGVGIGGMLRMRTVCASDSICILPHHFFGLPGYMKIGLIIHTIRREEKGLETAIHLNPLESSFITALIVIDAFLCLGQCTKDGRITIVVIGTDTIMACPLSRTR
jgi:hypothetical protein